MPVPLASCGGGASGPRRAGARDLASMFRGCVMPCGVEARDFRLALGDGVILRIGGAWMREIPRRYGVGVEELASAQYGRLGSAIHVAPASGIPRLPSMDSRVLRL